MPTDERLLEDLTDAQLQAARHVDGPLLVLAGPGSGKTTVVTRRVSYLIEQGIPPWQILALTFTNKAAGEMRQRIEDLVPPGVPIRHGLTVSTFHSFCVRLLRRYGEAAGLPPRFSVYDASDQREAVKQAIAKAQLSTSNWTPASVASAISNAKNRLQSAEDFAQLAGDFYSRSVAKAYRQYEKILKDNGALDFDDLLLKTATLLRDDEQVRSELQERYQYLLIDEYQDTNYAQFLNAHLLAAGHRNIFVVGDPDQAIYGWRGADIRNILQFEEHYPQADVVLLGENFRSTGHIVDVAAGLISCNRRRKEKVLSTQLGEGEKPTVVTCADEHHEAQLIVREFTQRHEEDGVPFRSMAVLYRTNALSRVLEEAFRDAHVPYVIARGTAFYDRKEIKDALAYLRLLVNREDEVALGRIVNDPPRGIGRTSLQRAEVFAGHHGLRLFEALRRAEGIPGLGARGAAAMKKFVALFDGWTDPEQHVRDLGTLVERVTRESGLEAHYRKSRTEEDDERLANLAELISAASEFRPDEESPGAERSLLDVLSAFLESVALVSDADAVDPESGAVTLMTLHTAKGLEFDVIAIAGLEEGLLPHVRAAMEEEDCEEERRLFFVGLTRARRHLLVTRAAVRTHRGIRDRTIPSRFLRELPGPSISHLDLSGEPTSGGERYSDGSYEVGALVRHPVFGEGLIESLSPRVEGSAARIRFRSVGVKTLILEYAKLHRLD